MKLKTRIGEVCLENPTLLASGYITETPKFFLEASKAGCAGMVTRSLKEKVPPERSRVTAPRYAVFGGGASMLNAEWGNEHPWQGWQNGWAEEVQATGKPLIISLSGRDLESCEHLIVALGPVADAFEINISCAHSGALHGNLNLDFDHLKTLMGCVRPLTTKPIWVKLAYSPFVVKMAMEAQSGGADAIVCTNTIGPGLLIDVETGNPKLGIQGGAGGASGPAIFPIALRCVYEISMAVSIPVVGVGGISNATDIIQMMMAGASGVQLYTLPALRGPEVFKKILRDLSEFLETHPAFGNLADIIGISHGRATEHRFEAPKPRIIEERCTGCGICLKSCAFEAMEMTNRKAVILNDRCISCNACLGVCPPKFNAIETVFN